jgi:hypothetical protein
MHVKVWGWACDTLFGSEPVWGIHMQFSASQNAFAELALSSSSSITRPQITRGLMASLAQPTLIKCHAACADFDAWLFFLHLTQSPLSVVYPNLFFRVTCRMNSTIILSWLLSMHPLSPLAWLYSITAGPPCHMASSVRLNVFQATFRARKSVAGGVGYVLEQ